MSDFEDNDLDFFTNQKPVKAIIEINRTTGCYGSSLSQKIDTTYAHTVKIADELEKRGYIKKEQSGRKTILETTERGQELAEKFQDIVNFMNGREIEV